MPATDAVAAMAADRVDFVDENNAGRRFLALLKHVAHPRSAHADEHLHEIRAADREERHIGFTSDGACEQRLAGSRRTHKQNALRNPAAEFLKLLRVPQKLDQLLHFILGFLDAGHVLERDLVLVARQHPRLRFAEVERAFAGHPDLLAEEEIENKEEERDREETNKGL